LRDAFRRFTWHAHDSIYHMMGSRGEMTTKFITRFAPSPTGRLHLGHAWSAMLAYDAARAAGGRFLLRIEDIDESRCRPEFVDGIYEDLRWLSLDWDGEVMIQSRRMDVYARALAKLEATGLLYRCLCTRADLAAASSAPQGSMGTIYPGTCRERAIGDALGKPCSWRLNVAKAMARTGPLQWHDQYAGDQIAAPHELGDVILARKDVGTSYHLAVTIDDAAQEVSHVVRGRDLFAATHIHRLLQALLDLPTPCYRHHALIFDGEGNRLAKRSASVPIAAVRDGGANPASLVENLRAGRFPFGFGRDAP
jgi:glutamyl-Q tRNA(Asp) synthetase